MKRHGAIANGTRRRLALVSAAVVGAVALCAVVAWRWSVGIDAPPSDAERLPRLAAVGNDVLGMALAASASTASNEPAEAAVDAPRASGTELVEVCGLGWVEPDATGAWNGVAARAVPDVVASQRALLDALRRDGDLGAATATVLELHGAGRDDRSEAPAGALLCTGRECASSVADRQLAAELVEQLARRAASTSDGRVYALAYRECERVPGKGSCALLNLEQWARLDDGNALPWLHVLERARQRGDAAQIQEALYRVGTAPRFDERLFDAAARIADHAGAAEVDVLGAQLLATDALLQASARTPAFQALMAACTADTLADANRRQACDAAATTLADRSDSLLAAGIGAALGRRLGWPDARIDALRGLQLAGAAMAGEASPDAGAPAGALPSTCAGARRMLALFSRQGRAGQVQAVREWLAANGTGIAPYAQQAHDLLRKRDEAQAANVVAASSPPVAALPSTVGSMAPTPPAPTSASPPGAAAAPARAAGPGTADVVAGATPASATPAPGAIALAPDAATPYSEAPPPAR